MEAQIVAHAVRNLSSLLGPGLQMVHIVAMLKLLVNHHAKQPFLLALDVLLHPIANSSVAQLPLYCS